jgi:hypothetical protein
MAILSPRRIGSLCLATRPSARAACLTRVVRTGCFVLVIVVGIAATLPAQAVERVAGEYEIKAAFLYNFAQYIEWPKDAVPGAEDSFIIGILGQDPFGSALDDIARDKTIQGKRIVLRRFATVEDYTPCHILFIASSAVSEMPAVRRRVQDTHVLLAADTEGLAQRGVVINFFVESSKVRFEINTTAAERAGIKISSKLLRLARIVTDKPETKNLGNSERRQRVQRPRDVGPADRPWHEARGHSAGGAPELGCGHSETSLSGRSSRSCWA